MCVGGAIGSDLVPRVFAMEVLQVAASNRADKQQGLGPDPAGF